MKLNPLNLIDFYKADHRRQYPDNTTLVFSNFTPRKSRIKDCDYVIFFGLQYLIKEYLQNVWNEGFFKQPKAKVLKDYSRRLNNALGQNSIGTDHIAALHDLGYLPITILALPEGAKVPIKVPPFVLWNTVPEFFWLVNYLETLLSASIWQMCTSATYADLYRKLLSRAALKTTGSTDFVHFQGHDFSFRGMSSVESAAMSGAGHLTSFAGTDSVHSIDFLEEYYNADSDKELVGCSVTATEHSVMCMGGKDDEISTFERLLDLYPKGILAVVSDTWDLWKVCIEYLQRLKDKILKREGKLVIRPDSGDPVDIICGYPIVKDKDDSAFKNNGFIFEGEVYIVDRQAVEDTYEEYGTDQTCLWEIGYDNYIESKRSILPQDRGVIELLWDVFGGTINEQGYKVLDPHIGAIYGDSITLDRAAEICRRLEIKGFASTNIVLGIGSFTYQYNTRDTQGWAMKATYGEVEMTEKIGEVIRKWTEYREIWKDPITDDGTKKSAKGLIAVYHDKDWDRYFMKDQATWEQVNSCALKPVFTDGKLLVDQSLAEIRARIANQ